MLNLQLYIKDLELLGLELTKHLLKTKQEALTDPAQIAQAGTALTGGLGGATSAMGGIGTALGYTPGTITDETITTEKFTDPGIAGSYMNPYQQQVVDVQTQEARRQADIAKAGRGMGSIGRGTFGGGRQALMESEADRALATQLGQIQATGSQQAYQQGQQAFTQDQARNLQMQKANQAADLQAQQLNQTGNQFTADLNKQLGLGGLQAQSTIGGQLGQLGALDQQTDLQRIQALAASGGEQQSNGPRVFKCKQTKILRRSKCKKSSVRVSIKYTSWYCRCIRFNTNTVCASSKHGISNWWIRSSRSRSLQ